GGSNPGNRIQSAGYTLSGSWSYGENLAIMGPVAGTDLPAPTASEACIATCSWTKASQGAGIAFEPDFVVADDVRAGRLVALLPDYPAKPSPIYAVYPTRKHLSAKVRLFVEYLAERFAHARAATPAARSKSATDS
ncbi:MAG: hypothetical protein HC807_08265, partial [Gammaproteobacteria bacterium]|nr:hypothetical protein [Gammaproteobacteria bacterium]